MAYALRVTAAAVFGALSAFFVFYTVRLAYINVVGHGLVKRSGSGMLIGAFAFPVAALLFGWISWRLLRAS